MVDMCTGRFVSWVLYGVVCVADMFTGVFVTLICVRMGLHRGYLYE